MCDPFNINFNPAGDFNIVTAGNTDRLKNTYNKKSSTGCVCIGRCALQTTSLGAQFDVRFEKIHQKIKTWVYLELPPLKKISLFYLYFNYVIKPHITQKPRI